MRTHDLGEIIRRVLHHDGIRRGDDAQGTRRRRGRLPVSATLTVAKQLCRALEVAHEQGVIHRDIKPQNMVVEPDGVLKVMDFGIARLAKRQSGMTEQGMVVGTPEYMAPEQLMGQDIDARADIYAAGCVIYECLTGTPPLTAENQFTLVAEAAGGDPGGADPDESRRFRRPFPTWSCGPSPRSRQTVPRQPSSYTICWLPIG